jgi:hypothetical protein
MPHVESSAVSHVSYDAASRILFVTFRRNPKVYAYIGVPAALYHELLRTPSIGAFVNLRIKPCYPVRELTSVRLRA